MRQTRSRGRANLELGLVALAGLVVALSQSILVPVLPILDAEYGSGSTWMLTSTLLVSAVAVPVMGRLGDMFGKRRILLISLGLLTFGAVIDAVADNLALLIAGRAIQGLGMAIIPLGISLLATLMPKEKVGSAVALISAMLGVGSALGLPLAGWVAEHWDWQVLMWISAAISLTALIGIFLVVPEAPESTGGRVDFAGALLLAVGLVCLIFPLEESAAWGWDSPVLWGLLAVSVLVLGTLVKVELGKSAPLVDVRALARRPIALTNLASACFGFALFASFVGTSPFVMTDPDLFPPGEPVYGFGVGAMAAGLTMLPSGLGMLLFTPVAARLMVAIGASRTLALGALVVALGWVERVALTDHIWQVTLGSTIIGIGTGIGYAAIPTLINTHTPAHEMAAANGLNTLFRALGSTLATAVGASLMASMVFTVEGRTVASLASFQVLFVICAVASLVAAVVALMVPATAELPDATPDAGGSDQAGIPGAASRSKEAELEVRSA